MDDITDAQWAQLEQEHHQLHDELKSIYTQLKDKLMKTSDMIVSKFLRKEDFPEDEVVTIKGIKQENVGREDAQEMRWVIYFRERDKGMVLNVTSIRVLESAFGDDTDFWKGKQATIYVDPNVSFQGRVVGGLRLRPIKATPKGNQAPQPKDDFNDDVPF